MSDIFDILAFSELFGGELSRKLSTSVGKQVIVGVVDIPMKLFYSPTQLAKAKYITNFVSCPFKIIYTRPDKGVMRLVGGSFGFLKPAAQVVEQTGALNSLQDSIRQGVFGYVYEVGARASVTDQHKGILKEAVFGGPRRISRFCAWTVSRRTPDGKILAGTCTTGIIIDQCARPFIKIQPVIDIGLRTVIVSFETGVMQDTTSFNNEVCERYFDEGARTFMGIGD